jgi:hypothetical protein
LPRGLWRSSALAPAFMRQDTGPHGRLRAGGGGSNDARRGEQELDAPRSTGTQRRRRPCRRAGKQQPWSGWPSTLASHSSRGLAGPIQSWPLAVRTLAITAVVVPLMVFLLLPGLQRLLASWYVGQQHAVRSLLGLQALRPGSRWGLRSCGKACRAVSHRSLARRGSVRRRQCRRPSTVAAEAPRRFPGGRARAPCRSLSGRAPPAQGAGSTRSARPPSPCARRARGACAD